MSNKREHGERFRTGDRPFCLQKRYYVDIPDTLHVNLFNFKRIRDKTRGTEKF